LTTYPLISAGHSVARQKQQEECKSGVTTIPQGETIDEYPVLVLILLYEVL